MTRGQARVERCRQPGSWRILPRNEFCEIRNNRYTSITRARKLSSPLGAPRHDDAAPDDEVALIEDRRLAGRHAALRRLEPHLDEILSRGVPIGQANPGGRRRVGRAALHGGPRGGPPLRPAGQGAPSPPTAPAPPPPRRARLPATSLHSR